MKTDNNVNEPLKAYSYQIPWHAAGVDRVKSAERRDVFRSREVLNQILCTRARPG